MPLSSSEETLPTIVLEGVSESKIPTIKRFLQDQGFKQVGENTYTIGEGENLVKVKIEDGTISLSSLYMEKLASMVERIWEKTGGEEDFLPFAIFIEIGEQDSLDVVYLEGAFIKTFERRSFSAADPNLKMLEFMEEVKSKFKKKVEILYTYPIVFEVHRRREGISEVEYSVVSVRVRIIGTIKSVFEVKKYLQSEGSMINVSIYDSRKRVIRGLTRSVPPEPFKIPKRTDYLL
ncbi:MAG: hypothetical protein DRJ63_10200 [Thermoprotei archaeon]|nr:MAG: hypothetical protein DRJ63_10200 [Thermoprotei archaeon]